jgi:glyoxylase-like metal-dependent hydrolase (beta-lactamase superfamily II)
MDGFGTVTTTPSPNHPTARAFLVRANNPSPMTLEGTNTWVLVEPGDRQAIVVDPGPDDARHRDAVMAAVEVAGANQVALIVLTHGHADHAEGAAALAERAAALAERATAPIRGIAPAYCSPGQQPLSDGEQLRVGGMHVDVIATPGHTADSACFVVDADAALLTGDTILGRGSTVVARPDGGLADYLATLHRLRALVDERQLRVVLPGHGPVVDDPATKIDAYLHHREERLQQVRAAALASDTVDDVLRAVYGDVAPELQFAARWSLLAQLDYLRDEGVSVPGE